MDDETMETSENAELLALQRIDDTCVKLQEQGKYLEALECMERGLVLRQHFLGRTATRCGERARPSARCAICWP